MHKIISYFMYYILHVFYAIGASKHLPENVSEIFVTKTIRHYIKFEKCRD